MKDLSVVVPTRALEPDVLASLGRLRARCPHAEIIVVEPDDLGRSAPEPALAERLAELGTRYTAGPRGRGTQCNAGAQATSAPFVMFLHDDTTLPDEVNEALARAFGDPATEAVCFRLNFDRRHWLLATYAFFSRLETVWTTFGDQAITMRRSTYQRLGGFPAWPLFEDVAMTRALRRQGLLRKLPCAVTTSARRFYDNGIVVQQWRNAVLLARFLAGASPWRLARHYDATLAGRPTAGNPEADTRSNRSHQ